MGDLPSGRYRIVPARRSAPPPFPIGSNLGDAGPIPVVSAGNEYIWTVTQLDNGNYTLGLDLGESWFSRKVDETVVVLPPGSAAEEWGIRKHDDGYTINTVPSLWPTNAWFLPSTEPGTQVILKLYEIRPWDEQLFEFIRVYE